MCPACISSTVLLVGGTVSAGGLTAALVSGLRRWSPAASRGPALPPHQSQGEEHHEHVGHDGHRPPGRLA